MTRSTVTKNTRIKEAMKATMLRRQHQVCHVYSVKIDESRLSAKQKEQLKMIFVEAKWLFNDCLRWCNETGKLPKEYIISAEVMHYDKDRNAITTPLKYIGMQMKQSVIAGLQSNIKTLATLKRRGHNVGRIRYRSEMTSLNMKQYMTTYKIKSHNKMIIQRVHGTITVNGLSQIPDNVEFANAKIVKKASGYYVNITTFIEKENKVKSDKRIGIDFGCSTNFTLSNGDKINAFVEESDRIKRLQRKLNRQKKGSNNRRHTIMQLRKEYEKLVNKKNDIANKIVHRICNNYGLIVYQDEQLLKWKVKNGKTIQHSVLGRVKAMLERKDNAVKIDRYFPTTKMCSSCGSINDNITLKDRTYICPICGATEDRDVHAANNMLWVYDNIIVGMGRTDVKRVELEQLLKQLTVKHEDTTL